MRFDEYAQHDGLGLAELIAAGQVTAGEVLEAAIARADAVNPKVNAIVLRQDDAARARAADGPTGPLAGVPFLIKDLLQDEAGVPTTGGCRGLVGYVPTEDAEVVRRWRAAGLISFGRTNTPEFGSKAQTESDQYGAARNPWDLTRTPGGSSGGSAAAVAAGIVPVAGASDGGGSIRIPAACCGLVGLKPSRGLVPNGPVFGEPVQGSTTSGVISRTVRDTAAVLDALAGGEPTSPFLPAVAPTPYLDEIGQDPGRLRIGVQTTSALRPDPHPEAVRAAERTAQLLSELGHEVELVPAVVDDRAVARDFLTTWFVSAAALIDQVMEMTGCGPEGFEVDTRVIAALGRATSAVEHSMAIDGRHAHVRALADFFSTHDLLLTPTLAEPPIGVGALATPKVLQLGARLLLALRATPVLKRTGFTEDLIDKNLGWVPFTQLANITGRPAVSLPLHWTPSGLPLGVQFVAPLGGDATLIRLAAQLEDARPWRDLWPAGFAPGERVAAHL